MIHFTCDFCGTPISPEELRFQVRIEVRAYCDGECGEEEAAESFDDDPFDELESCQEALQQESFKVIRFDLCRSCHDAFSSDPLGKSRRLGLRHFEN